MKEFNLFLKTDALMSPRQGFQLAEDRNKLRCFKFAKKVELQETGLAKSMLAGPLPHIRSIP